jgi:hypothetical protein
MSRRLLGKMSPKMIHHMYHLWMVHHKRMHSVVESYLDSDEIALSQGILLRLSELLHEDLLLYYDECIDLPDLW